MVTYKRERYEALKSRSRGRMVSLGREWFMDNWVHIEKVIPKTTRNRRRREEKYYLLEDELKKVEEAKASVAG